MTYKVSDFIGLIEPLWVLFAGSLVYVSVIFEWISFIPWLCLALAFTPLILRSIKYGRSSIRTPFDVPLILLLAGMIIGVAASEYRDISLEVFQSFLACVAFYYSIVNYSRPDWLVKVGLLSAVPVVIAALVIAVKWTFSDVRVPNGLGIVLVIIMAIALGIAMFYGRTLQRVISGLFALMFLGMAIIFTHAAIHRLYTLESIEYRLYFWQKIITPIEGSSLWTGLGLGSWPLINLQESTWMGHTHNAYLEVYVNTGIIGLVALICFLAVGAKLSADILYFPRDSFYYGFGAGVILAAMSVLAVSFLESVAFGFGALFGENYHYILSPIPFILAGALVIARRLLREGSNR